MTEKKIKYRCRHCSLFEAIILESGESFDGGDDWYEMLCRSCGKTYRTWIEHD